MAISCFVFGPIKWVAGTYFFNTLRRTFLFRNRFFLQEADTVLCGNNRIFLYSLKRSRKASFMTFLPIGNSHIALTHARNQKQTISTETRRGLQWKSNYMEFFL